MIRKKNQKTKNIDTQHGDKDMKKKKPNYNHNIEKNQITKNKKQKHHENEEE